MFIEVEDNNKKQRIINIVHIVGIKTWSVDGCVELLLTGENKVATNLTFDEIKAKLSKAGPGNEWDKLS